MLQHHNSSSRALHETTKKKKIKQMEIKSWKGKMLKSKLPSVSRQIRHWICSEGPASRSIEEGSTGGRGGTRGEVSDSEWSAIKIERRRIEMSHERFNQELWIWLEKEKKNFTVLLPLSSYLSFYSTLNSD